MSARARERPPGGLLAALLARAGAFLLEPHEARPAAARAGAPAPARAPLVAVSPVAAGCDATAVARGLAAELARRHAARAAVVCGWPETAPSATFPRAPCRAAGRLAHAVSVRLGAPVEAAGRLCLVSGVELAAAERAVANAAPIVADVACGWLAGPAAVADGVVLVCPAGSEPALVAAVARRVSRPLALALDGGPLRAPAPAPTVVLPSSRAGAALAHAGRRPPGSLGAALAELADLCLERPP